MTKVMLRLRKLDGGKADVQELESVEAAVAWLAARPTNIEVLGVVFEGLTREDNDRMKAAMRPLDAAEQARVEELDAIEEAERERKAEARRAEDEARAAVQRVATKNADPNRPMELRYRYDNPNLVNADPFDDREVPAEAREAVAAWVAERTEWVEGRGQIVGEAKVTVLPGAVPKGKERVVGGTFIPVTAPAKG
jgi:hypothetical protein